jgi:DNA-binding CsgD family transcriptional regulator
MIEFPNLDLSVCTDRQLDVILVRLAGASWLETSRLLGCSVSTARTHCARGFAKLGNHCEPEEDVVPCSHE